MKFTMQQYQALGLKTESPADKPTERIQDYLPDQGPRANAGKFFEELCQLKKYSMRMDIWKRFFYYGKKELQVLVEEHYNAECKEVNNAAVAANFREFMKVEKNVRAMHAILGIATEGPGELLLELFTACAENRPLDAVQIFEECGDILWYLNLILSLIGKTVEQCAEFNIQKLQERHKGAFNELLVFDRDIEAEREILRRGYEQDHALSEEN